jgi:hypothetical protein
MTLQEWHEATGAQLHKLPVETVRVFTQEIPNSGYAWDLFHLSDYVVVSAESGPSYYLMPRGWSK